MTNDNDNLAGRGMDDSGSGVRSVAGGMREEMNDDQCRRIWICINCLVFTTLMLGLAVIVLGITLIKMKMR